MPPKKKTKVDLPQVSSDEGNSDHSKKKSADKPKRERKNAVKATLANEKTQKILQNKTTTEFHTQDFNNVSKTVDGKNWNFKIASWNVDGLRAWIKVIYTFTYILQLLRAFSIKWFSLERGIRVLTT